MSGLFGIGGSAAKTDRNQQLSSFGDLSSIFNFANPVAQNSINTASNFFDTLLSGDPTAIAKLLGPQIGTIQNQAGQQKATNAEFGNRSGGTNAANQEIDAATRGNIDTLIGNLTGAAASSIEGLGLSTLGAASGAAGTLGSLATNARGTDLQQGNLLGSALGTLFSPTLSNAGTALSDVLFP